MSEGKETSFKYCPLCHSVAVRRQSRRSQFWRSIRTGTCTACGALFVASGPNRYRLQSCDPATLGVVRGRSRPQSGCSFCPPISECYLDRSLSESDWEHVGRGEPLDDEKAFFEAKSKMESGELPVLPPEQSPVVLEAGEQLHHVGTVYTCEQPLPGDTGDEGKLVVTSRRLVLEHGGTSLEIALGEIDRLEKAFPGFLVYTKGSNQPFCFFPRRGDPVFYAVEAALRKVQGEK